MGELDSTYGSLFIGILISAILFGITNLQTFIYLQWYPQDNVWIKSSVCWLWLLDALHLALCSHMLYHYLITELSDPLERLEIVWSFKAEMILVIIITVFVQTLYAMRIWILAGLLENLETKGRVIRNLLRSCICTFVVMSYGVAAVIGYEITQFYTWADLIVPKNFWITFLPSSVSTAVDVVIASSMCYLLRRYRTGLRPMDSVVNSLMLFTVNTGMVTVFCAIINIAITAAFPDSFGMLSVGIVLGKCYVNCFLAMLNARKTLRSRDSLPPSSIGMIQFQVTAPSSSESLSPLPPVLIAERYKVCVHMDPSSGHEVRIPLHNSGNG